MKNLLLFLFVACCYVASDAGKCTRPNLSRHSVYIYSTIGKVPVKISRCLFNDTKDAYSDISDNCVKAFQSGVFVDKWSGTNKLAEIGSPIVLEEYVSRADLVKNEVGLRSGSVCRYDRGFCYDPTETNTYAVVWEILSRPKLQCPDQLFKVFEGDVDFWDFPLGLSYLFYYDNFADEAFSLGLKTKGQCQETDVWYTEEGYIVSKKPLIAKNIDGLAALKTKPSVKGGTKGGIKGGVKGGRITAALPSYFYLRSKKIVSKYILQNCDILSSTLKEVIEEIDSEHLEDSQNLHLLLKRYYEVFEDTKKEILDIIERESTLNLTLELKQKLKDLSQQFDIITHKITDIEHILANAGDLKGIRPDVDKLALEISKILKKNGKYDELLEQISLSIKQHSQGLDEKGLKLKNLSEKLEEIQTLINNKLPNLITRAEFYDKLNEIQQNFHKTVKDLTMNVTLLLLEHEGSGGVKGKGTSNLELEQVVLDKLKGFNLDQQQAAIDALRDKLALSINELRSESYNNVTHLEDKISKKIADLSAQNEPILDRLNKIEKEINSLNSLINNFKSDIEKFEKKSENIVKDFETKITKIWDKLNNNDKILSDLKKDLAELSKKEVDFKPVYKKIDESLDKALKPRDSRLDALDDISSRLTESVQKDGSELISLQNQIDDINKGLKNVDALKGDITDEFEKEVRPVHKKLSDLNGALEEHSKKQSATHEDLQNAKNGFNSELDKLGQHIKEAVDQLNITLEKNSGEIIKLFEHDTVLDNIIGNLKKDLGDQGQSIKNLESYIKEKSVSYESSNVKVIQLIGNLNENVTELFNAIKKHEESILELDKECEKAALGNIARSSVKTSPTKGGVKTSGTKGGVKTATHYNQPYNDDEDDEEASGKRSRIVQTSVNNDWSDDGGSYTQTKTTRVFTKSSQGGHSGHLVQNGQDEEIDILRSHLSEAQHALHAHEHKIEQLEKKINELVIKVAITDNALTHSVKSLNDKLIETDDKIELVNVDIKGQLSRCCSIKSSYAGIKH